MTRGWSPIRRRSPSQVGSSCTPKHTHRLECYHCHSGPNFTDNLATVRSAVPEVGYHNNGLYNLDGRGAYPVENRGIAEHTGEADDVGRFRTPTLRNVGLTAPYMHDGSILTLRDVVKHYAEGGRTITHEGRTSKGSASPLKDPMLGGFEITSAETDDLLAFLESLSDPDFLRDPRLSDPWPAGSPAVKARRATPEDK